MRIVVVRALLLSLSGLSAVIPATGQTSGANAGKDLVHQLNEAFEQVYDRVSPTVVVIDVAKSAQASSGNNPFEGFDFFFKTPKGDEGGEQPDQSEGSGFVIRSDGYVLTNNHVIDGADRIQVKFKDGRVLTAKVIGSDDRTDIAVIKVEANNLPVVELGNSDEVKVGQLVCAIGAPYKFEYTFTTGVVSAKGRNELLADKYEDYIQTDASINPGNSGGPLCDIDGKVIGMNTLINGMNRGLGFAIPSNMAKEIGSELIAGHKIMRPWLGIRIETLGDDPDLRDLFKGADKGVVVRTIEADAPASKSDLRPFDVITHVDGTPIETDSQLQHEILKKKIGQSVQLSVWRKGQSIKVPIKTGELPSEIARASNALPTQPSPPTQESVGKFGLQVQELTKDVAERLHLPVQQGVVVTDVEDNSIAASQDIQREDVITEVDGKSVTNVKSFREALNKADPKRGVLLYLDRKGSKTFAVLKAGS